MVDVKEINALAKHSEFGKQILERFVRLPFVSSNDAITRTANSILARLNDESFKIAVVGGFSSGKSTFLNAIIGKDCLPHGVNPTTDTIVMIKNTKAEAGCLGKIYHKNGKVEILKDYEQIIDVTTTKSAIYDVKNEIDSVELFIPFIEHTEIPVVLMDTPGLNDTDILRKEITMEIIEKAHACIYILHHGGIRDTDKNELKHIGKYQHELIILQNSIDKIKTIEGDTIEGELDGVREELSNRIFNGQEQINYMVCGISALKALAGRDPEFVIEFPLDKTKVLTDALRKEFFEQSNYTQVITCIKDFIQPAFRRSHVNTLHIIHNLLERTAESMEKQYVTLNKIWENSGDAQFIKKINAMLDNWDDRQAENEKKIDSLIISKVESDRKSANEILEQLIERSEERIDAALGKVSTLKEWDEFNENKQLELEIADCSNEIFSEIKDYLCVSFDNIYKLLMLEIQEFTDRDDILTNVSLPSYNSKLKNTELDRFVQEEEYINKSMAKLNNLRSRSKATKEEIQHLQEEESRLINQLAGLRRKQNNAKREKESTLYNLGQRPNVREYYDKIPVEVDRFSESGFFGWAGWAGNKASNFLFGKKIEYHEVKKYDSSERQKWDKKKKKLEDEFTQLDAEFKSKIRALERKIESNKLSITTKEEDFKRDTARIAKENEIIKEERLNLEQQRDKAAREFVENSKKQKRHETHEYLNNTLKQILEDNISVDAEHMRDELRREIKTLYAETSRNEKENIKTMLKSNIDCDKLQHKRIKIDLDDIFTLMNELEEYVCNS